MVEHSDLVDRADALMRRRSSFVAPQAKRGPADSDDDDLPVLTEVVPAESTETTEAAEATGTAETAEAAAAIEFAVPTLPTEPLAEIEALDLTEVPELPDLIADSVLPPLAPAAAADGGAGDVAQVAQLGSEIAGAIVQRLNFELPTLVEAALLKAGEELRGGIASTIDDVLRDFVEQRKHGRKEKA